MRITGPNGTTLGAQTSNVRRTSSGAFSLPAAASASETRPPVTPKAAAGIDTLLALQGIEEDPVERRKRSGKSGRRARDGRDELKSALGSGKCDPATVGRLREEATK